MEETYNSRTRKGIKEFEMFVPVVDKSQSRLMPTTPSRARRWIKSGKATPFWKRGIFCVRLNLEPSSRKEQDVAIGIDPGSKKEAFTVKSKAHTYLNVQSDAISWVKDAIKRRRQMRRGRRYRKTPCRAPRFNRSHGNLPPSTKARWALKLRVCRWLTQLYPISVFIVEDIKAKTKGQRRWDVSFSPLEVGKRWFYSELLKMAQVEIKSGWETKQMRDELSLKKSADKLANIFESHALDSWVLANSWVGGHEKPDNKRLLLLIPLQFHRRQLHLFQPGIGGIRKLYGGTRSLGFQRGSLVKHPKYGVVYIGGSMNSQISLHSLMDAQRRSQNAKPSDCKFLTYSSWRVFAA